MKQKECTQLALHLGNMLAREKGFTARHAGNFVQLHQTYKFCFWIDASIRQGVGEITLNIGVEIPSLKELISLVPSSDTGDLPCVGGPAFRFADLTSDKLHDYIVKLESESDAEIESAFVQLCSIWDKVVTAFFQKYRTSSGWGSAFNEFLATNRLGPLRVPILARACVAWFHAKSGSVEAERILAILASRGPRGRPVQDYEEAVHLHEILSRNIKTADALRDAIAQTS